MLGHFVCTMKLGIPPKKIINKLNKVIRLPDLIPTIHSPKIYEINN